MLNFEKIVDIPPFSLDKEAKAALFNSRLAELTAHHYNQCQSYKNILDGLSLTTEDLTDYTQIPFLPVTLFKNLDLISGPKSNIVTTLTSSGTSGQAPSKIFLDKSTAANQQKALVKIIREFTKQSRLPFIVIDSPKVISNSGVFSARAAGILGFSIFGSERFFALNDDMTINTQGLSSFLEKYKGQPVLLFGFTFIVWHHFIEELLKDDYRPDLSSGLLIHGGGWKHLANKAVDSAVFRQKLKDTTAISHVHDYYGMAEQTGCIYMECSQGYLHASIFSDILIRDPFDFSIVPQGKPGIIQVLSLIPESYPGHSLLTEDQGIIIGEDNCPCGQLGKYFKVIGRLPAAELRGCSDTYAANF